MADSIKITGQLHTIQGTSTLRALFVGHKQIVRALYPGVVPLSWSTDPLGGTFEVYIQKEDANFYGKNSKTKSN